jgi:type I restriction enzyme S subunit
MLLKEFIELNPEIRLVKGMEYPFLPMDKITPGRRYVRSSECRKPSGGAKFSHGDTLFARISPCLENGKIAQFISTPGQSGFGSTEYWVFRARNGISDPDFVFYLANSQLLTI